MTTVRRNFSIILKSKNIIEIIIRGNWSRWSTLIGIFLRVAGGTLIFLYNPNRSKTFAVDVRSNIIKTAKIKILYIR